MSIRRKQRQRGKKKGRRKEALAVWARLSASDVPSKEYAPLNNFASVVIPMVRRTMPSLIANSLVGVHPMTTPVNMFGNAASGIEPVRVRFNYDRTKKEIQEQRKAERKAKKFARRYTKRAVPSLGEVSWDESNFSILDD